MQGFGGGNMGERDHLEDIVVDGRIILKCNLALIVLMWRIG